MPRSWSMLGGQAPLFRQRVAAWPQIWPGMVATEQHVHLGRKVEQGLERMSAIASSCRPGGTCALIELTLIRLPPLSCRVVCGGSGPGALARARGPIHGARSASRSTNGPRRSQPDKHDRAFVCGCVLGTMENVPIAGPLAVRS